MRAFRLGRDLAVRHVVQPGGDLTPVLKSLGLEVVPWRFRGRLREVIFEGAIGIEESLPENWQRWLTAHAIGHHALHTGTSFYLASWQWVNRVKAERQAEEFAAGLLLPPQAMNGVGEVRLAARCGVPREKARWALEKFGPAGDQER
ncbi:MAG: ImmA/IrrE family metallo-endopeptidase [Chloroflexi bacterium]|nr:ImmA/IrrE family metallo-endopeptidase [Chloroflexota bacterium]